jgi:KaiC/GvpD/RAD55 family RecA-like ATPase
LDKKKSLLETALKYIERSIGMYEQWKPFAYWNMAAMYNELADIEAEMGYLEPDLKTKRMLLEEAASNKEKCLALMAKRILYFEKRGMIVPFASLYGYQDTYWTLLSHLYELTNNPEHLKKAIEITQKAMETAIRLDMVSLMAESHWKIAKAQDILQEYLPAAENFEHASESYSKAAEKIPKLKDLYQDYASYMQAWSEIEKARHNHARQEYSLAKDHFDKAAQLHRSLKQWSYLAPNYAAWAQVERAEELSRKEQGEEAFSAFEKAAKLFDETKESLQNEFGKIENIDEKIMARNLIKSADQRREYCMGRIALEEARILDKKGDHYSSSEKYGSAAEVFEKVTQALETEEDRKELKLILTLSKAWQKMTCAEADASPTLYMEASELFEKAKEFGTNEKTKMLALGHSRFCKALEVGTKFADTRDIALHARAIQHLESAANYYVRAGFQNASEYAKATELLLDAYTYIDNAKKQTNPEKKAKFYVMAEKVLRTSAGSFMKAEHPEKSEQVRRLLERVKEERELALSLTEVLHAPSIVSATTAFSTPTPTYETAVGLERFEHADVQANITTRQKALKIGENLDLEIELVNAGKCPALLIKLADAIPEGFELTEKPDTYRVEDSSLNMKGKRLDPLKTEEFRLVLRSFDKGMFEIKPSIIYVDETGHQMSCEPEPVTINVSEIILPGRVATGYGDLDNLLLGGLPESYSVLLTSPSCDERDLLIRRFLEMGAKKGEVTFYITADASGIRALAEECQSNFYLFICNPRADEIIESLPNVFKLKGVENLTEISIALASAFRRLDASPAGPRRSCIEIISDVLLQHHAVSTRRWLTSIIPELRSRGFNTLAVMNPQMHPPQEVQAIPDLFEGEINIYERGTKKGLEKFLRIKKMHNEKYLESELPLRKERLEC